MGEKMGELLPPELLLFNVIFSEGVVRTVVIDLGNRIHPPKVAIFPTYDRAQAFFKQLDIVLSEKPKTCTKEGFFDEINVLKKHDSRVSDLNLQKLIPYLLEVEKSSKE